MDKPDIEKLKVFELEAISTGNLTEAEVMALVDTNRRLVELDSVPERSLEQEDEFARLLQLSWDLSLKSHSEIKMKEKQSLVNKAGAVVVLIFVGVCLILYLMRTLSAS